MSEIKQEVENLIFNMFYQITIFLFVSHKRILYLNMWITGRNKSVSKYLRLPTTSMLKKQDPITPTQYVAPFL